MLPANNDADLRGVGDKAHGVETTLTTHMRLGPPCPSSPSGSRRAIGGPRRVPSKLGTATTTLLEKWYREEVLGEGGEAQ